MKQTGLLIKIDPRDYRVGASPLTLTVINDSGDWVDWKPSEEKQYKDYVFDTMSCATFSALNVVENTINWMITKNKLGTNQLFWLQQNGYIVNGKINCSDRFNAIVSGTTDQGNYMQNVWDSIRNIGCIPESMLPFGGNSVHEYLDPTVITQSMRDLAEKFLEIFSASYEWTSGVSNQELSEDLKQCPLQIAIFNGSHAVELINIDHYFDTYPPFLQPIVPISYALKGIVTIKQTPTKPTLKIGSSGSWVETLQKNLNSILGFSIFVDGKFGPITFSAVKKFQAKYKLVSDGIVGKKTWQAFDMIEIITEVCKKYDIEPELGIAVACCESGLTPTATLYNEASKSTDRGLFQWNNKYHSEISDAQAFDPVSATTFFCKAVKDGHLTTYWSASEPNWKKMLSSALLIKYKVL